MKDPVALCDVDGTLLDSRPGIVGTMRWVMEQRGHALDPHENLDWIIGPPMKQTLESLLSRWNDADLDAAFALYRRRYLERGVFEARPFVGIAATLEAFSAAGWTLMVATGKRAATAQRMLEHFGLAGSFAAFYGSVEGGRLDNKPELVAHILTSEGIDPGRTLMIGDRRFDVEGAHACGLPAIGVAWGYGGPDELRAAGADVIAAEPAELPALAAGLLGGGAAKPAATRSSSAAAKA